VQEGCKIRRKMAFPAILAKVSCLFSWRWTFFTCFPHRARGESGDNGADRLGFLGRVIHGVNPGAWLKEMRQRLGEKVDFASVRILPQRQRLDYMPNF